MTRPLFYSCKQVKYLHKSFKKLLEIHFHFAVVNNTVFEYGFVLNKLFVKLQYVFDYLNKIYFYYQRYTTIDNN